MGRFRCLAFKNKQKAELRAKSGKPLTRYFPEVVAALETAKAAALSSTEN
jgi:ATP-dependent DNA ligase